MIWISVFLAGVVTGAVLLYAVAYIVAKLDEKDVKK